MLKNDGRPLGLGFGYFQRDSFVRAAIVGGCRHVLAVAHERLDL
jgi:hypothetical protein